MTLLKPLIEADYQSKVSVFSFNFFIGDSCSKFILLGSCYFFKFDSNKSFLHLILVWSAWMSWTFFTRSVISLDFCLLNLWIFKFFFFFMDILTSRYASSSTNSCYTAFGFIITLESLILRLSFSEEEGVFTLIGSIEGSSMDYSSFIKMILFVYGKSNYGLSSSVDSWFKSIWD